MTDQLVSLQTNTVTPILPIFKSIPRLKATLRRVGSKCNLGIQVTGRNAHKERKTVAPLPNPTAITSICKIATADRKSRETRSALMFHMQAVLTPAGQMFHLMHSNRAKEHLTQTKISKLWFASAPLSLERSKEGTSFSQ